MGRFFILLLGILIGAAGVGFLLTQGYLPYRHRDATDARSTTAAAPAGAAVGVVPAPGTLPGDVPTPTPAPVTPALPDPAAGADLATMGNAPAPAFPAIPLGPPGAVPVPKGLLIPVAGVKASQLVDTFTQSRGEGRVHDAIDIMAAKGTPVLATADGRVVKLFTSVRGGLTLYQFDSDEKLEYYYAHLDGYAPGIVEGKQLKRGDLIGFVGSTGDASPDAPHLHFTISVLGPEKNWWQSTAINPFPLLGGQ
jgi:murein DD-endopeptidase MepM/ murein hydrolase activator NlpD